MKQNTLGERIKHHRKQLGLTQEQLAERMGVSPQAVSKWENNLSCPDIAALPQLAEIFGVSVDELLGKEVHSAEVVEPKKKDSGEYQWTWKAGRYYSLLFAAFVLLFGGLWMMNVLLEIDVKWWTLVWTLSLIYAGLCGLRHRFSAISVVLSLVGLYFLLSAYDILGLQLGWNIVAPACVVIVGISLFIDVLRKKRHRKFVNVNGDKTPRCECTCENGMLSCEMAFGDHGTAVKTDCLRGGSIEASFGNSTVDFSEVESIAPSCGLSVECSFGNLNLLVPERYAVRLTGAEQFAAGVAWHGKPAEITEGVLNITSAEIRFGNVNIRYI